MDARAAALAALVQVQVTETSLGEALQRIADITHEAVPSADVVSMSMLRDDGRPTTAVYTFAGPPEMDEAQDREGKGPCLDAWRDDTVLRVPRVEDCAAAHPTFAAACLQQEMHSTLSLPMRVGDVSMGAIDLYARVEDGFSERDESIGTDLAAAGAAVLLNVCAYRTAFDLTAQLNEALTSRAVIEQAKGMLMGQNRGLSPDEAFALLRSVSQRENVKLRDVARRLVEGSTSHGAGAQGR